eukprot:CAMPEP_0169156786 /NCGR_PEP_ID=MMETSP1015-20121227/54210_1 /TAXON_ID=342587 /ORGANISM="Karlodinium micrum, Strain CCMP2283" /LENGTH=95 /DNA_ID=CAMNT_0009227625 /DNA_START=1 /DNA_END=285 /DNA_ORIENTATION=-
MKVKRNNFYCDALDEGVAKWADMEICSQTFVDLFLPFTLIGGFVHHALVCSSILNDVFAGMWSVGSKRHSRSQEVRIEITDVLLVFGPSEAGSYF